MLPFLPDLPAIRGEIARFHGAIRHLDFHFGRLVAALEQLNRFKDTLVVFTTDHGIAGARAKGTLYGAGLETALLMRGPHIPEGARFDVPFSNLDIFPTLLDAAQVPIPPRGQGRSFWSLATGGEYEAHDALFFERNYHGSSLPSSPDDAQFPPPYDPMRAVRTRDFHLIRNFEPRLREWRPDEVGFTRDDWQEWYPALWPLKTESRPEIELFDLQNDPLEQQDVARDPAYAATRQGLLARLENWMRQTNDPLLRGPIPDPAPVAL